MSRLQNVCILKAVQQSNQIKIKLGTDPEFDPWSRRHSTVVYGKLLKKHQEKADAISQSAISR